MKIPFSGFCDQCYEEAKIKGEKYLKNSIPPWVLIELNEKGVYSWKCDKNHTNWIFLQEHLFQILFDLGVLAISDGYTREAVSSFATGLERFYEFIIKLILLSDNIDEDLITKSWKELNQSERQLGAYITLFGYKFNRMAPILENKWIKFRNEVLHQGDIPSEEKALLYGQIISDLIFDVLFVLKEYFKEDIHKIIFKVYKYRINTIKKENPQIKKAGGRSGPNIIQLRSIKSSEFKKIDLATEIQTLRISKKPLRITYIK